MSQRLQQVGRTLPGLALALALLVLLAGAGAAREPWDQAEVTRLSGELEKAIGALLADPGIEPKQATALQQRKHHSAIVDVRELERWAGELAQKLRGGHGYDSTRPLWLQMLQVRDEIRWYARDSFLTPPARAKAEKVGELMNAIAPYYAEE